jgi:SPP1 gp7 family putative phage head morphogenesis protein
MIRQKALLILAVYAILAVIVLGITAIRALILNPNPRIVILMKSDEYWALRALQREAESHDGTKDTLKRLAVMYGDADKELVRMMDRIFQNYRKYTGISEKEARELLSAQETAELMADLQKLYEETGDAETLAKLNAPAYGYRISRLQAARRAIEAELDKLAAGEEKAGSGQLVKAYDDSYYKTMYDTLPDVPGTTVTPLLQAVVNQAVQNKWKGENYSSRVWKNRDVLASEGGKIIDAGVTAGKSIQQMATELSDLMNVGAYAAARLVRTEVNRMHNDAAIQSYKAMGVKEYTYLATLDARTCAVCGALDLKVFKVSEAQTGVNLPPMHPNDRCTITPKIPGSEADGGSRTARDPETGRNYRVPADMNYEKWRKDISEKYGADSLETAQKKYRNRKADAEQMKTFRKVIGKDAPDNLADFQNMKYNEPEQWNDMKYYVRNINGRPVEYVKIDRELEKLGIVNKGKAYPAEPVEIKGWRGHAERRLVQRGLTKEQAVRFMNQAKVMMKRYPTPNTVHNYYCKDGVIGVKAIDGIVQTAYGSKEFKTDTLRLLEVIDRYVPDHK